MERVAEAILFFLGLVALVAGITLFALVMSIPFAQAAEPRSEPSVFITTSVGYTVALKTGTALPPGIAHGVAVVVPLKGGWGYLGEVGVTTSFTALRPSILLITGPSKKLASSFVLGGSIFYKLTPPYDGASAPTHVLGGSIAPIFPIAIGSLSFPVGVGVNLTTGDPTLAFNLKLAIKAN